MLDLIPLDVFRLIEDLLPARSLINLSRVSKRISLRLGSTYARRVGKSRSTLREIEKYLTTERCYIDALGTMIRDDASEEKYREISYNNYHIQKRLTSGALFQVKTDSRNPRRCDYTMTPLGSSYRFDLPHVEYFRYSSTAHDIWDHEQVDLKTEYRVLSRRKEQVKLKLESYIQSYRKRHKNTSICLNLHAYLRMNLLCLNLLLYTNNRNVTLSVWQTDLKKYRGEIEEWIPRLRRALDELA